MAAGGRAEAGRRKWTRRHVLAAGLGGATALIAAGVTGVELIDHGVLPGKAKLDALDGACSVPRPVLVYSPTGPSFSGTFYSAARRRTVGYTLAYPPGHHTGDELPLVIMLHGYGASHADALAGMSPAQAVALKINGRPPQLTGIMGISMGGYGALLLAEKHPHLFAAVAAISPAVWTSYQQAKDANAGAYASAAAFAASNVVTHTAALAGLPVRIAAGNDDPFYPGVRALARALPAGLSSASARAATPAHFSLSKNPRRWPSWPATW